MRETDTPVWLQGKPCPRKKAYLSGRRIAPPGLTGSESLADVIDLAMLAYNGARLREACELIVNKMLEPDVTVGLTLAGALTPAGLGRSCIVPLINAGFVDWIVAIWPRRPFAICRSRKRGSKSRSSAFRRNHQSQIRPPNGPGWNESHCIGDQWRPTVFPSLLCKETTANGRIQ